VVNHTLGLAKELETEVFARSVPHKRAKNGLKNKFVKLARRLFQATESSREFKSLAFVSCMRSPVVIVVLSKENLFYLC